MRMMVLAGGIMMALLMAAGPVWAEDAKENASQEAEMKKAVTDNPHIEVMNEKARELAESLTREEAETLGVVRENFGILGSVEVARRNVKEATGLCADKNEDMTDEIGARHKSWHDAIGAELDAQNKNLEQYITKDYFSDPKQVRAYLDSIDDAAQYASNSLEKTIITNKDACRNLLGSMDKTEEVIIGLVKSLEWPHQNADDAEEKAAP